MVKRVVACILGTSEYNAGHVTSTLLDRGIPVSDTACQCWPNPTCRTQGGDAVWS